MYFAAGVDWRWCLLLVPVVVVCRCWRLLSLSEIVDVGVYLLTCVVVGGCWWLCVLLLLVGWCCRMALMSMCFVGCHVLFVDCYWCCCCYVLLLVVAVCVLLLMKSVGDWCRLLLLIIVLGVEVVGCCWCRRLPWFVVDVR